jgi:hypothetical protein
MYMNQISRKKFNRNRQKDLKEIIIYIHTNIDVFICLFYACMNIYDYVYMYVYTYTYIHVYMFITYIFMSVFMCLCIKIQI